MKSSIIFRVVFSVAFLCLITLSAAAQGSGVGAHGYTSIDYDEATNIVTAYSETDVDYELSGNYQTNVQLVVSKSTGGVAASGSARDNSNFGYAEVLLNFAGEAGITYTAVGRHNVNVTLYDYYDYAPYQEFYHDEYYLSYYLGENVYEPWFHFFESPGYRQSTIQIQFIRLGRTYDSVSTSEPKPTVTINVPATAKDGDTVTFSVTTENGTPTAYLWSFEAPSGAGNNPQVNFTAPTAATTQAEAHWFANPNSECPTIPPDLSETHPYYNSRYKIKVKVTFQGGKEITKESNFTVNAWWKPAGSVAPATISGIIRTGYDNSRNLFVVIDSGTLARTTYPAVINVPTASQFYNKTLKHEEKHVLQWQSGLFKDIRAVSGFMAVISNFTDTTAAGLQQHINDAFDTWDAQQAQDYKNLRDASEIEAYAISDSLAPQYAYQRCGRTSF